MPFESRREEKQYKKLARAGKITWEEFARMRGGDAPVAVKEEKPKREKAEAKPKAEKAGSFKRTKKS